MYCWTVHSLFKATICHPVYYNLQKKKAHFQILSQHSIYNSFSKKIYSPKKCDASIFCTIFSMHISFFFYAHFSTLRRQIDLTRGTISLGATSSKLILFIFPKCGDHIRKHCRGHNGPKAFWQIHVTTLRNSFFNFDKSM